MTIILSRWWCSPFTAFNEKAETYGFNSKYRFDGSGLAYSEYTKINNDRGWVGFDDASEIIFAER
jgi:hypothetical protein